jgi:hypothetical protein
MSKNRRQRRERERSEAKFAAEVAKVTNEKKERFNDVLGLSSFACGLAAWGWSVIAPNSSTLFGSVLLLAAVVLTVVALRRMWLLGGVASSAVALVALVAFGFFDWYIVVKPQRGKPFQDLLVHGYHLTSECGTLAARQPMPDWLRDESKAWQAQVDQLITEKLPAKDSQIWQGAIIYGKVSDVNTVAYQCTWLANKVGALETIVSTEYDSGLKHKDYNGPTYWFEPVNGKVDISEALKAGTPQSNIAIEDFGNDKQSNQATQVTGSVPQKH